MTDNSGTALRGGGGGYGSNGGAYGHHAPFRGFANPAPLGLSAMALTLFVWSLINVRARDVEIPNIVIGLAFFYGGVVLFASGMWEIAVGNTFGATALASYGGFWMAYALLQLPTSGILGSYAGSGELDDAYGFFFIGWFIFSLLLWVATLRTTASFIVAFGFLWMKFMFLAIHYFTGNNGTLKAAGILGLLSSFGFWWAAFAGLFNRDNTYFGLPAVNMGRRRDPNVV